MQELFRAIGELFPNDRRVAVFGIRGRNSPRTFVCGLWVALGWPHPCEFAKSKNRRRFDVSRNSRRAQSDAKVSRNDIEMSRSVDFVSILVDFRSHSVDFRPVVSADAKSRAST